MSEEDRDYLSDIVSAYKLFCQQGRTACFVDLSKKKLVKMPGQERAAFSAKKLSESIGPMNVGVGIIPGDEWVLDVDDPKEFMAYVAQDTNGRFPKTDTLLVKSPRGFHYHFFGEAPTHRKAFPGADVVGSTLMIIMPPSRGYTYLRNTSIVPAAPQLMDYVRGLPDTGYKGEKK